MNKSLTQISAEINAARHTPVNNKFPAECRRVFDCTTILVLIMYDTIFVLSLQIKNGS
jgi:hypothetical protein